MGKKSKFYHFEKKFRELDWFGVPITFNAEGVDQIKSMTGALISFILSIFFLTYSIMQAQQVYTRNYNIQADTVPEGNNNQWLSPSEQGMMMAFAVTSAHRHPLDDPAYVEWSAHIAVEEKHGKWRHHPLKVRKCSRTDYEKLMPIKNLFKDEYELLKKREAFYCFDNLDEIKMKGGSLSDKDVHYFSIDFIPCQPTKDKVCNKTLQETLDYLKTPKYWSLQGNQVFQQSQFGNQTIKNETLLVEGEFGTDTPKQMLSYFQRHVLTDQTAYLQVGQQQTLTYHQIKNALPTTGREGEFPHRYKILEWAFLYDDDLYTIQRQTFDILAFIGNIGGLLQGLQWIGLALIAGFNQRNSDYFFHQKLFKVHKHNFKKAKVKKKFNLQQLKTQIESKNTDTLYDVVETDYLNRVKLSKLSCCTYLENDFFCCRSWFLSKRQKRAEKFLNKGTEQLEKELDILNLIKVQRLQFIKLKSIMTPSQLVVTQKLSEKILDSDEEQTQKKLKKNNRAQQQRTFQSSNEENQNWIDTVDDENEKERNQDRNFFFHLQKVLKGDTKVDEGLRKMIINQQEKIFKFNFQPQMQIYRQSNSRVDTNNEIRFETNNETHQDTNQELIELKVKKVGRHSKLLK